MRLLLLSLVLLFACAKPADNLVDRDPFFTCDSDTECSNILEMRATLNAPIPINYQIKIDNVLYYDSCSPNDYNRDIVRTNMNVNVLEMKFQGFEDTKKVDLVISDRGRFCASLVTRIKKDDFVLRVFTRNNRKYYSINTVE